MQLTLPRIAQRLNQAALVLCAGGAAAQDTDATQLDAGVLVFSDPQRVSGVEALVRLETPLDDNDVLSFGLNIDAVTGASPNGATPSNVAQTFTNASGFKRYQVAPAAIPTSSFNDNRLAAALGWEHDFDGNARSRLDGNVSLEFDYQSAAFSAAFGRDFDRHNTSLEFSLSAEAARVHPVGGIPQPLALMRAPNLQQPRLGAAKTRRRQGLMINLSQVLDARTLLQINLGYSRENGYLTDPYKIFSLIEPGSGATLGYRYEERPKLRRSRQLYTRIKRVLDDDVLDASLRLSDDDWGVSGQTLSLQYRLRQADRGAWVPLLRVHRQSAAEFYRHSLAQDQALPDSISADDRLAALTAITLGIGRVYAPTRGHQWRWQIALYRVTGDSHPGDAIGLQRQLDLYLTRHTLLFELTREGDW